MIAKELNIILDYLNNPESNQANFDDFFDNGLKEEFFWRMAGNKNQFQIFKDVLNYNSHYFSDNLAAVVKHGVYTNIIHFSSRFLNQLSEFLRISLGDFSELIKIIDEFILISKDSLLNQSHMAWFISEVICELPSNLIKDEHLLFIANKTLSTDTSLVSHSIEKKLIPRLIENNEGEILFKVIDLILFNYKVVPNELDSQNTYSDTIMNFDPYALHGIINKENIRCFLELINNERLVLKIMSMIQKGYETNPFEFSSFNIPTIEETDQLWNHTSFSYLLVKFLREVLEEANPSPEFVINNLLKSENDTIKRVGIHAIGWHYNKLNFIFWEQIGNPLNTNELKHEVFVLLQRNAKLISKDQLTTLFNWIDTLDVESWNVHDSKEECEHHRSLVGKEYLAALTDVKEEFEFIIGSKKAELDKIYPHEREHPGYNSYHSMTSGYEVPDEESVFEANSENTEKLVHYILANESEWSSREQHGQLDRIRKVFTKRPELINDIQSIRQLNPKYFSEIMYGLERAFEEGGGFEWKAVFEIINFGLTSCDWESDDRVKRSFIGSSAWLIRAGVKNDDREISKEDLGLAKDICLSLLKLNVISPRLNNDPFFDVLNSPEGKVLEATINVLLRNARKFKTEKSDKWYPDLKEHYTSVFKNGNYNDAYMHHIGSFLPQITFLDRGWVKENIDYLFPKQDISNWRVAMSSYVKRNRTVYKDIFDILLNSGQFDYGIEVMTGDVKGISEFVQQIVVSSIANWEGQSITDKTSLINKLLNNGKPEQISGIISYFFINSIKQTENILPVWNAILQVPLDNESKQDVYKDLLKLIARIPNINVDYFYTIKATLSQIKDVSELYEPVRYLAKTEGNEDIENRAKLLMLCTSDNLDRHVMNSDFETIAEKLYIINRQLAEEFINNLVSKRVFSLLDIYRKHYKN
ncbi:hypothetical protein [Fluviicola sp.]|uniref:hypothetical protein n=1 Tax=Fluviicola sp. TaxID=1917219 RepID=UPI003D2B535C